MHLRRPENLQGVALLKRPGILKTDDFLDCIDNDLPKGECYVLASCFWLCLCEDWKVVHSECPLFILFLFYTIGLIYPAHFLFTLKCRNVGYLARQLGVDGARAQLVLGGFRLLLRAEKPRVRVRLLRQRGAQLRHRLHALKVAGSCCVVVCEVDGLSLS